MMKVNYEVEANPETIVKVKSQATGIQLRIFQAGESMTATMLPETCIKVAMALLAASDQDVTSTNFLAAVQSLAIGSGDSIRLLGNIENAAYGAGDPE